MARKPLTTEKEFNDKIQEILPNKKAYFVEFLKGYRERTKKYYETECKDSPDVFQFMNPILIISVFINSNIYDIVMPGTNRDKFINKFFYLNDDELQKFYANPDHIRKRELLEKIEKDDCLKILEDSINKIYYAPTNLKFCKNKAYADGSNQSDNDYDTYNLAKSLKSAVESYKDISDFNILDLDYITRKVNDNEFKYEIEESAKAYKAELFLASALTAEVCIETLLKIAIIRLLGNDKLPENQLYIYKLGSILKDNKIIDGRLFKRIQSVNILRHGIAHSDTGIIEKWDAEQVLSVIKILVDALF